MKRYTRLLGLGTKLAGDCVTGIYQFDVGAGLGEILGTAIGRIVVSGNEDILTPAYAKAIEIDAGRVGGHHAGAVIVAKSDMPFERASGNDGVLGTQGPKALPRHPGGWRSDMIGDPLKQASNTSIVKAKGSRAWHQTHPGRAQGFNLLGKVRASLGLRQAVSAQDCVLLD
jgi:hypothetical protein